MNLIYTKDIKGKEILCNEDESHQIMMEWEKSYMEKSIELLNPYGKVLEIGFGMGYSARKICSFNGVYEYNVIECTPIVWDKFEEFKNEIMKIRPDLKINLIKGRWEDVISICSIYDCIYFDDYDLDVNSIKTYDRFNIFLYNVLLNNTKINSKICKYSTHFDLDFYKEIECISCKYVDYNIEIPDNCKYAKGNKMFIPIITKINQPENNLRDKLFKNPVNQKNISEQMSNEFQKQTKYRKLFDDIKTRSPSCGLIIIDNFYNNPYETRNFVLTQEFLVRGNYPGQRTISYANEHLKSIIQKYVEPFGGKITDFPIPKADGSDSSKIYNGSFQFTTSRDRSWVHIDGYNNWAGVLYLTPNAPLSSGTSFYNFYDGTTCKRDMDILENKVDIDKYSQDLTKWNKVDQVGNIFNRLILFNSNRFHMSMDYFGDKLENGRLFQVFFFSTER